MSRIIGVVTRYYPAQASVLRRPAITVPAEMGEFGVDHTDPPPTRTVFVEGDVGDYAAYTGHGSIEWVADHGDKICFEEAKLHFPGIEREKYRSR